MDHVGRVVSYFEDDTMTVVDEWPFNFGMRGQIDAARATLVRCDVVSVEDVKQALATIDAQAS